MATQRSPQNRPSISKNGLQILQDTLAGAGPCDSVFIAIDFESTTNLMNGFSYSKDSQVGIATLDTQHLHSSTSPEITTHNFITGSPRYTTKAMNKFLFSKSTITKNKTLISPY